MTNVGAQVSFDPESTLAAPGGKGPLRRDGEGYVSESGERFEIERGVLRTLRNVDPLLARELETQTAGVNDYSDPKLLMPRYEHNVAELAVERIFSGGAPKGAKILDAGCGIGLLGRLHPELGLVGLDASMTLLEQVKGGYKMLVEASAEALPFRDGAFDTVVAINMLHHVITPENAVREFARVLKPGGTLVAVDPRKVWPIEVAKKILRGKDTTFAPTHKAFAVDEYETIIRANGAFSIEDSQRMGLFSLIGLGGLDAVRLSRFLPTPQLAVDFFTRVDNALFQIPGVPTAGLNLVLKARRA